MSEDDPFAGIPWEHRPRADYRIESMKKEFDAELAGSRPMAPEPSEAAIAAAQAAYERWGVPASSDVWPWKVKEMLRAAYAVDAVARPAAFEASATQLLSVLDEAAVWATVGTGGFVKLGKARWETITVAANQLRAALAGPPPAGDPTDRLEEIRHEWFDEQDLDEPMQILDDVVWLIREVERLRAALRGVSHQPENAE